MMRRHIAQHENERSNKILFFYLAFRFYFSGAHCCFFFGCCAGPGDFRTVVVVDRIGLARFADATTTFLFIVAIAVFATCEAGER